MAESTKAGEGQGAAKSPAQEAAEARAKVKAAGDAKEAAKSTNETQLAQGNGVRVKGLVNMHLKDGGGSIVKGAWSHISQSEHDRLKAERRFKARPSFVTKEDVLAKAKSEVAAALGEDAAEKQ